MVNLNQLSFFIPAIQCQASVLYPLPCLFSRERRKAFLALQGWRLPKICGLRLYPLEEKEGIHVLTMGDAGKSLDPALVHLAQ